MGMVSIMQCMLEVLGLVLSGSVLLLLILVEICCVVRIVGYQVLYLVEKNIIIYKILIFVVFENVIKVYVVIGGSINVMIYFLVIVYEFGWELKFELFDWINNEIFYLINIQFSGEYVIEMMWFVGGVLMV